MTTEQVQTSVETLEAEKTELERHRNGFERALTELKIKYASQYFARDPQLMKQINGIETELALASQAFGLLSLRQQAAKLDLMRAQAATYRSEAAVKLEELSRIEKKTRPLLEQLSKIEGVAYEPHVLSSQRSGLWFRAISVGPAQPHDAPDEVAPNVGFGKSGFAIPASRRLRIEAAALELKAGQLDNDILFAQDALECATASVAAAA